MNELSLDDLASVSGCGDAADAGTPPREDAGSSVTITCPAGTYAAHQTTTSQDGSKTITFTCRSSK